MQPAALLRSWVQVACLVVFCSAAQAFESEIRLMLGMRSVEIDAAPLVPDPEAAGYVDNERFFRSVLSLRHDVGSLRFFGQGRIVFDDSDDAPNGRETKTDSDVTLDELTASYALDDTKVLFLGRRNISAGQSLGVNPADVFLKEGDLDRSLPAARRRSEIEGIDMVGSEFFFADGSSLLGYWAPSIGDLNEDAPHRAYARYRTTFGADFADIAFFAFDDTTPGAGLSIAYPFGSGLILYGDKALRKGRSLPEPSANASVGTPDANRWTIEGTLGLGYIFESGLAMNLEYTHLSGGYDTFEWGRYVDAIRANTPPADPAQGAVLAALGRIAQENYLRRNYAFLRLHRSDILGLKIDAEWTVLYGVDDESGSVNLHLSKGFDEQTTLFLSLGASFGEDDDEFRRGVESGSLGLFLERVF
ncbi:MAG: hypothetical protein ISN28_07895 [Ectothiorhodospiraceae bacterium AqS1]|nr:hypothetical protein [Ectothiorhodospiraceae bacterium AqS1]